MGGTGNDTYYYNLGDGWDIIEDNDGTGENSDTISFGAGIALADLTFTQRDTNLEIVIKGDSSQGIVINRFFDPSYRKNFCIEKPVSYEKRLVFMRNIVSTRAVDSLSCRSRCGRYRPSFRCQ